MSKDWRIILRFATLGLAVAAGIYAYFAFFTARSTDLDIVVGEMALVLCPPSILCFWFCGHDTARGPAAAMWFAIGPMNAALYALIGAAYVGLKKKPEAPATS